MSVDRTFSEKDLWRIYCNHLSGSERAAFKRNFKHVDGDCGSLGEFFDDLLDEADDLVDALNQLEELIKGGLISMSALLGFISGYVANSGDAVKEVEKAIDVEIDYDSIVSRGRNSRAISEELERINEERFEKSIDAMERVIDSSGLPVPDKGLPAWLHEQSVGLEKASITLQQYMDVVEDSISELEKELKELKLIGG